MPSVGDFQKCAYLWCTTSIPITWPWALMPLLPRLMKAVNVKFNKKQVVKKAIGLKFRPLLHIFQEGFIHVGRAVIKVVVPNQMNIHSVRSLAKRCTRRSRAPHKVAQGGGDNHLVFCLFAQYDITQGPPDNRCRKNPDLGLRHIYRIVKGQ